MKRRLLRWLARMLGLQVRHVVVVRNQEQVCWTGADAAAWRQFRRTELWRKIELISDDSICHTLYPANGTPEYPADERAVGRKIQMSYLARLEGAAPAQPSTEDANPDQAIWKD